MTPVFNYDSVPDNFLATSLLALRPRANVSRMVFLQQVLPYVQIVISVLLIGAVVLQRTGASLGGAFGADNFSSGFHTRRGFEKTLFRATIALGILFALSALINLIIS